MTDAELVEASRRGEREAFGQLVNRYQDVVCAVSYSSTGNWALSEDVAQETFIAAWRQLGQLRETARVRAWLCQIARNLARKARHRTDREAREDAVEVDADLAACDVDPFSAAAQAEVDRVVREALARIPDRYRETLVLYYCEQQSIREVATTLGIAEDAAMQRLSRGRKHLAKGVTDLVERSLQQSSARKDLRVPVMAALPLVDPLMPPPKPGSTPMMKFALIAAAVTAVAGTTAVLAVTSHTDSKPPAASSTTTAAPAASPASLPSTTPPHAATAAAAPPRLEGGEVPEGAVRVDDHADVIPKATLARLGIERGPSRGPVNAPVTIVVFQDVMCTYCSQVLGTIDQLFDEYPGKLRLVVKQFPVHKQAMLAAEASLAADAQGKFWELHDVMVANQDDLSRDAIVGYAKQAGLDDKKIASALDAHTYAADLAKEVDAGKEVGVRATPEFLINGKDFVGARPIEEFRASIEAALAE